MTEQALFAPERKPWERSDDPRLAPSSYAASAVFGLTELAMETLHEAGHGPHAVSALMKLFARVTIRVHSELGSGGGWDSSLHTRLRGALRTSIRLHPIPDSVEPEGLDAWELLLYDQVTQIARASAWLYALTPQQMEA